ncbi:uncharacterized protein [Pyrus communis]|uniref:uncharacterized protein n=1 Tax=Pyrus communis TaxID=23211 RepID=UPI0035BFB692
MPFLSLLCDRNLSISSCCVLAASSTVHFPLLSFSFRFSHPRTEERWKIRVLPFASTDFSISLELRITSLRMKEIVNPAESLGFLMAFSRFGEFTGERERETC